VAVSIARYRPFSTPGGTGRQLTAGMNDIAYLLLTLAVFAVLALVGKGAERL